MPINCTFNPFVKTTPFGEVYDALPTISSMFKSAEFACSTRRMIPKLVSSFPSW